MSGGFKIWKTYSSVFGFWEEPPNYSCLSCAPQDKYNIRLPSNVGERDGPSELVEQATGVDSQTRKCHTLGTHLEGQHFDRVESLKRCNAEREDCSEQKDHGDGSFGSTHVFGLLEQATCSGHANPDDGTSSHTSEHETTSTEFIDEGRSAKGEDELEAWVAQVDIGLLNGSVVASSVEHGTEEVS
jgi:hypothetical protein